jgi:hypothetical protein
MDLETVEALEAIRGDVRRVETSLSGEITELRRSKNVDRLTR